MGDKGTALSGGGSPAGTVWPQRPEAAGKAGMGQPMKTEEPQGCRLGCWLVAGERGEKEGVRKAYGGREWTTAVRVCAVSA